MQTFFEFPYTPAGKDLILQDRKIIVISFFGKTAYDASGCKSGIIDRLIGHHVFQPSLLTNDAVDEELLCNIEGYHDRKQQIIFLNLRGVFDVSSLVRVCDQFCKDIEEKGYLPVWAELKSQYARALMFLFMVSHILVVHHPTYIFDTSYIHLFRALDVIRQKAQPSIIDLLRSVPGISKEWVNNCRACSPRVLFLFSSCPAIFREDLKKRKTISPSTRTTASASSSSASNSNANATASDDTGASASGGSSTAVNASSEASTSTSTNASASGAASTSAESCGKEPSFSGQNKAMGASQGKAVTIKKLEHALEDQIYHILRKSRVITNNSSNSLFAIPANLEFVFVQTKPDPSIDKLAYMVNSLVDLCKTSDPGNLADNLSNLSLDAPPDPNEHTFKAFLEKHIDQAFTNGFDDNVGRYTTPGYFETPTSNLWYEVANKLYSFFLLKTEEMDSKPKVSQTLHNLLDIDVRFSESRCGKVLPLASATYQENLPTHYTRDYHEGRVKLFETFTLKNAYLWLLHGMKACMSGRWPSSKRHRRRRGVKAAQTASLAHALSVFAEHARGPLFDQFAIQLEKECDRYWRNGRQMCEVLSLTGNPCTNPLHRGGGEGAGGGGLQNETDDPDVEKIDRSQLPVMEHSSGVRYVSACNCGRKQGPREDPFTMRAANYDFYKLLSEECGCSKLESILFPVFQPSTQDYRAAQLFSKKTSLVSSAAESLPQSLPQSVESKVTAISTPQGNTQGFSFAGFVSGQSGSSDLIQEAVGSGQLLPQPPGEASPVDEQEVIIQVSDDSVDDSKDKSLVRQPSTTEYLPGMLHTHSPAGLLPQFPSWSLVCLGPSSLYSHNLGLQDQQQAGLLGGSAYLLPWDVTVRLEHHRDRASWPAVGDSFNRNKTNINQHNAMLRGRKTKGGKDLSEFVVKIFVGVEYECPRGHRFMCSAPDRVLKTTGTGLVKDNGNRVTGNDMPLYFPCPCRSAKPLVAQLMRIHVVTPKAPIHVTLNPCVQPAPSPCPVFVTGSEQPLKLSQSAYWVLRLPYVYVGENGPYIAPKEPVPLNYGRLLAGVYGISEISPEEK